jgi:hypothetical protein
MRGFWDTWRKEIIRGAAIFCGVLAVFFIGRHLVHRVRVGVTNSEAFAALRDLRGELGGLQGELASATNDHEAPHVMGRAWAFHGSVAPGKWVWIHNVRGSVTVEPSQSGALEISAVKTYRSPSDSARVRIVTAAGDSGLAVCAVWSGSGRECGPKNVFPQHQNLRGDVSVDFTVRLPARVRLGASTMLGDLRVRGARAPLWLHTVNGAVDATTTQGPVDVHSINGAVRVRVEGFADTGIVDIGTVNGAVIAELPATLDAEVHAHTNNGSIETDYGLPVTGKFPLGQDVAATVGKGGRLVNLKTINGAVQLNKIH